MADMIADGPEEDRHLRTIAAHTSAYITHVRRQLKHTLPKAIVHCLVRHGPPGQDASTASSHGHQFLQTRLRGQLAMSRIRCRSGSVWCVSLTGCCTSTALMVHH